MSIQSYFKTWLALCFCLSLSIRSSAQSESPAFGETSAEEREMKECPFDRSADAVILLDHAVAYFNDQYNLITERRIRLKILKEKGIGRGDINIPFYSGEGFEFLRDIEAQVTTPGSNGTFTVTTLERKNIFERKINSLYSVISFALPNIKVGSIIDYKYISTMKSYGGLRRWEFQKEIPVITSSYELAPIANSEFAYSVYRTNNLPVEVTPNKEAGKVRFVMHNIPGLRDEVYTASTRNFLQRVNFQFASFTNYYGKTNYSATWQQLATELIDEPGFGSQAKKDLSGTAFLKGLSPSLAPAEKVKTIYDFVRSNITWNNFTSKYCEDGVKNILEKKKGNSGDINLLLVSLLKSAGLDAYPLLVSERDNGLIDTTYSYLEQFNKVVAFVSCNGTDYVLDGTDQNTPFFMVPTDLLNTIGFLVDKKKHRFIYFKDLPHKQRESIRLLASISEEGMLEGSATVSNGEYAKLEKVSRYKSDQARYQEALVKPYSFLKVDSFSLAGLKNDSAMLEQQIRFHSTLKKSGGYYLLNTNLFTGLNENPFITQYRFTDIDFGSKYSGVVVGSFILPASFATEALPANKKLVSQDRTMSVSRIMEKKENILNVRYVIEINRERFVADEYEMVKGFFKEMVDLLNEPVLLKSN
ncbi:DUF3857 domain-containing protein [Flavisolibacter nicotianae]|uniref:DUF3857 domain-containing protein n=1 Tax=Flavisolibacter nicotianae TaxID=2364882 RepID=UPI000EAD8147|nr:DUF3857 domain-containing protein [Flavisolibacter nicotianae]